MGKPYAEVIGDPIAHSKSPLIHGFWLARLGLDMEYRAVRVAPDDLAEHIISRRTDSCWRGCNVTVPHKQAVIPSLDRLTALATEVGAVNTIGRSSDHLIGDNTDVRGIIDAVGTLLGDGPRTACLIGSGGAALAALTAFRRMGVTRVGMNVRDQAKGEKLLGRCGIEGRVSRIDDRENIDGADLIVNATVLGMNGQQAMPTTLLDHVRTAPNASTVVFDMVYAPLETAMLAAARERGLRAVDGLAMLVGQAAVAFEIFFGVPAPREHDVELRALLTS